MINEPEMIGVRIPKKMYATIEERVVLLYKELNITNVPIDPFDIVRKKGYILKPFSHLNKYLCTRFTQDKIDGISYYDPNEETYVIQYDDRQPTQRVRFTIMHEVGHIVMGHMQESELARKIADYFAAYSLAPSPIIHLLKCEDYMDISDKFNISSECSDYCFTRYANWLNFGGGYKPYEISLLDLFQ